MMIRGLEEVDVNHFEYGFLTTDTSYSAGSFQLHFPKLMPQAGPSDKKVNTVINNNILVNSPDCKPQSKSTVTTQGFLTIPRFQSADLKFKADSSGIVRQGSRFIVVVMDHNIRDMYVTDNI